MPSRPFATIFSQYRRSGMLLETGPAARRLRVSAETPGAGKEAERRYTPPTRKGTPFPRQNQPSMMACFISCPLPLVLERAPDRTVSTAGRDRPAPWNPRSGFEGEGAIQGDVSRPERSGGRVTATEKKLIARGRLSPTKEVTGGRRATMAQESGASASSCGRGADCASAREPGRPNEERSLRERARV